MSNMVASICEYLVVKKINTTAYHPACNGLTERMNATLCQILSNYTEENQTDWDEFIQIALFAYRSSIQETTLMTPFELLYNRQPRLPNDLEALRIKEPVTLALKSKWLEAKKRIQKVNDSRKAKYDAKFKERKIQIDLEYKKSYDEIERNFELRKKELIQQNQREIEKEKEKWELYK